MPEFLDKFINTTLPDIWDKMEDWWSEMTEESSDSGIYIAAAIVTVIICLILVIIVHNANKRDRKFIEKCEMQSEEDIANQVNPSISNTSRMNSVEKAIARADFESIMNIEAEAEAKPEEVEVEAGETKPEESEHESDNTDASEKIKKNAGSPILMEKIEIVRTGSGVNMGEESGKMTFDTSRSGRTYTEKELAEIIK